MAVDAAIFVGLFLGCKAATASWCGDGGACDADATASDAGVSAVFVAFGA